MKTPRNLIVLAILILAVGILVLRAQQTTVQAVALPSANIASLRSYSDAQLEELLAVLAETPTILPAALPCGGMAGTYYSLANPEWPPFPGDIQGVPVWSLSNGCYLLNDLSVTYNTTAAATATTMTMSANLKSDGGGVAMNGMTQSGVPYLTITQTGTNQFLITVINDASEANYELWWTPVVVNYPWTMITNGITGQTNFTVTSVYPMGFYRAVWDTNDIPIWKLADPNNPGAGILAVFIDNPTNGMVLQ